MIEKNIQKPLLFLLIGIPASGKTSFALELRKKYSAEYFSSDDFREFIFGFTFSKDIRDFVFNEMLKFASRAISCSKSIILDTTFLNTRAMRYLLFQHLQNVASGYQCIAICFCNVSTEVCIARDQQRKKGRNVGEEIIRAHALEIEFPTILEKKDMIICDSVFATSFFMTQTNNITG